MSTIESVIRELKETNYPLGFPKTNDLPPGFELPTDLSPELFRKGLSCYGHARLIVLSLGGPEKAKIFGVVERPEWNIEGAHAFVIPEGAAPDDMPLNDNEYGMTNGIIKEVGQDVTEWVFNQPWSTL